MITYREAKSKDYIKIAELHVISWQQHYRGDFSDQFLDEEAASEREEVWKDRLINPSPNQFVLVAEQDGEICGFACAFMDDNVQFGALLDNLHVSESAKGRGIGKHLISLVAQEVLRNNPTTKMYLWVLKNNRIAIGFYERLGGVNIETVIGNDIGDKEVLKCRMVWDSLQLLAKDDSHTIK
ncbi:N-acetyltransferase [Arenibacter sp. TNZ]|jgi:ribosomal protein S18 acetylase RimI-like enzyme|uniref:GNAT family N-acetyltransferase n=1 Tax=Arenibacter TaxID=178469 RepID=UPI000CD4873A|nr:MULTISPECIES: GNAT family N-acetyltransferase [Arenibacter]MCM4172417.1 N-acetyltransferase [Arenibacter sp. TNZ]